MINKFLIKNPIITEKAIQMGKDRKYVFLVAASATTAEVKKAVQAIYNVQVTKTNVLNIKGKKQRFGYKITGKGPGYKKVIVTLKEGQKLDILPQ